MHKDHRLENVQVLFADSADTHRQIQTIARSVFEIVKHNPDSAQLRMAKKEERI